MVWRSRGSRLTIRSTCGLKPMSSIRSASSRTRISTASSVMQPAIDEILEPTGRGDDDVRVAGEVRLRSERDAAVDGRDDEAARGRRETRSPRSPGRTARASGRGRGRQDARRPAAPARRAGSRRRASCPSLSATSRAGRCRRAPAGSPASGSRRGWRCRERRALRQVPRSRRARRRISFACDSCVVMELARDLRPSSPHGVERSGSHGPPTRTTVGRTVAVGSAEPVGSAVVPISFARGAPSPACLDPELLSDCARVALERDGRTILSYGTGGGYGPLRELLGERHGVVPGRVFLTTGGLQGFVFYAAAQLSRRPGRVLVEGPTYDRPLKLLGWQGVEVVSRRDGRRGARPGRARGGARAGRRRLVPLHHSDLPEPERPNAR